MTSGAESDWEFQAVLNLTSGRNRAPVVRFFSRPEQISVDMILKTIGRHVIDRSLCCEYFGNAIAREMGLHTPTPHMIDIDSATASAINSDSRVRGAGLTIPNGMAVASEWLRPSTAPATGQHLGGVQAEEAARIYAYDLMLQQPDRTVTNPNVIEVRGHFVAIDFETSCSFLFSIGSSAPPWRVSSLPYARNHFFRSRLRRDTVDWRALVGQMLSLDVSHIAACVPGLPSSWHDDCERVLDHIQRLRDRMDDLAWEIISTVDRPIS